MSYRPYPSIAPRLIGYDPSIELSRDHLVWLVERVVEESVGEKRQRPQPGNQPFDPRLCLKVLLYGYLTGTRSSRQLERLCHESLPYLLLTRGVAPGYRKLCEVRVEEKALIEQVWVGLLAVAEELGMKRAGRIVVDSTKIRANASPEAVVKADEYEALREELARILAEAAEVDCREDAEGYAGETRLEKRVENEQMRDILRRVRRQLAQKKRETKQSEAEQTDDTETGDTETGDTVTGDTETGDTVTGEKAKNSSQHTPTEGARSVAGGEHKTGEGEAGEVKLTGAARVVKRSISKTMRECCKKSITAIDTATAAGQKYLCITDPGARIMGEGRTRHLNNCFCFEVAVDGGLLVAAQVTQECTDNGRLETLVDAARKHEPEGVKAVDADSGYYSGDMLAKLILQGIDLCVPDSNMAAALRKGAWPGSKQAEAAASRKVVMEYDSERDEYRCPNGNVLKISQTRQQGGQMVTQYRAVESCTGCPLVSKCLRGEKSTPKSRHRTLNRGEHYDLLQKELQRFGEKEHRERYGHRADQVETVFGFIRNVLGYGRWLLRGKEKVECEGSLIAAAYQFRKVYKKWSVAQLARAA